MSDDDNIIDAEIVDSLPAVSEKQTHESSNRIEAERDWPNGPTPERRCKAHSSRTGLPCKNAALLGATVCRFHGGAAKHVKAAARTRLENAADRMARQLLGIALTADSEAVMLAAVKDALDRAGLKAPSEVVLSQSDPKPYEQIFEDIGTGSRAESRAARGLPETDSAPAGYDVSAGKATAAGTRETLGYGFQAEAGGGDNGDGHLSSPASAFAADTELNENTPSHWPHAPAQSDRPARDGDHRGEQAASGVTREPPTRHVVGDDALAIAAQLARQKAIESPHKKYRRP